MRTRRGTIMLLVLLALLINLPLGHGAWTTWRLDRAGTVVTATVDDTRILRPDDPRYFVDFAYPRDVDPEQRTWTAQVTEAAYDDAVASEEIDVEVLPDAPATFRAEGQVTSGLVLAFTLIGDAILAGIAVLAWRLGGSLGGRPDIRMVATDDVKRCKPGTTLERVADLWVASGEVVEKTDDSVVLDLGDRRVVIELDGYTNPVGYQQPAQAVGRIVG
jgi:hypothetical protein